MAARPACASAYPSSPPSWMLPGVCTLTWLGMPPGEENCRNSAQDAFGVGGDVRVDLGVGAFEVCGGDQRRAAVPRAGDVDPVRAGAVDEPVQQDVDHRESGAGAPVAEQPRLDVLHRQRFAQERVALEVDLADREVVQRVPPAQVETEVVALVVGEVLGHGGGSGHDVLPEVATTQPAVSILPCGSPPLPGPRQRSDWSARGAFSGVLRMSSQETMPPATSRPTHTHIAVR